MSTQTVSRNGQKVQAPLKALRAKCLDCSGGSRSEVKHCPVTDCPLYPFRLGKNPFRQKRVLSDDQRRDLAERLSKARQNRKEGQFPTEIARETFGNSVAGV